MLLDPIPQAPRPGRPLGYQWSDLPEVIGVAEPEVLQVLAALPKVPRVTLPKTVATTVPEVAATLSKPAAPQANVHMTEGPSATPLPEAAQPNVAVTDGESDEAGAGKDAAPPSANLRQQLLRSSLSLEGGTWRPTILEGMQLPIHARPRLILA